MLYPGLLNQPMFLDRNKVQQRPYSKDAIVNATLDCQKNRAFGRKSGIFCRPNFHKGVQNGSVIRFANEPTPYWIDAAGFNPPTVPMANSLGNNAGLHTPKDAGSDRQGAVRPPDR